MNGSQSTPVRRGWLGFVWRRRILFGLFLAAVKAAMVARTRGAVFDETSRRGSAKVNLATRLLIRAYF